MCVNIGHADDRVIQAIAEQVAQLPYVVPAHATEARGKLGRELARISPEPASTSPTSPSPEPTRTKRRCGSRASTPGRLQDPNPLPLLSRQQPGCDVRLGRLPSYAIRGGHDRRRPHPRSLSVPQSAGRRTRKTSFPAYMQYLEDVIQREGPGHDRGLPPGADYRHQWNHRPAGRLVPRRYPRAVRPLRHPADRR